MTVYHVWKPGQDEPEVVEAVDVIDADPGSWLCFVDAVTIDGDEETSIIGRSFAPHEWSRWSVVPDDASNKE